MLTEEEEEAVDYDIHAAILLLSSMTQSANPTSRCEVR